MFLLFKSDALVILILCRHYSKPLRRVPITLANLSPLLFPGGVYERQLFALDGASQQSMSDTRHPAHRHPPACAVMRQPSVDRRDLSCGACKEYLVS